MIVIGWVDIPSYAIECINSLKLKKKLLVLTNNKKAKEKFLNFKIKIINLNKNYNWKDITSKKPSHFFFTGWNTKAFMSLAKTREAKNICMIDNIRKNNLRQFFGKFYFKFFLKYIFDAIFVPGVKSKKFINYLGYKNKIYQGLYSCSENIFYRRKKITKRKYDFIYVGQFIKRKNILGLVRSFKAVSKNMNRNIKLKMIGYVNKISFNNSNIEVLPFINSKEIAKHLNDAKCLVLPSYEDHWGIVVHEAIRCGCVLLLSNLVGSKSEFLKKNGFSFDIKNYDDLSYKMKKILKIKNRELIKMSNKSIKVSKKRSLKHWNFQFNKILKEI